MEKTEQLQSESKTCEWCGEEIKREPVENDFLTGVFSYQYCSKECEEEHIYSK